MKRVVVDVKSVEAQNVDNMGFKRVKDENNKTPYDLSKYSWECEKCGGKPLPKSKYERTGFVKYCRCDSKNFY